MNKSKSIIYIFICLFICSLPLVGMLYNKTNLTTEKKTLAEFPKFKNNNDINIKFLPQLGEYFTDHFAYRQEFVSINSYLNTKLFNVSGTNNVISGNNGWLYYKDSLNDYIGKNTMSDRALFNVINNISMIQEYANDNDKTFVFTIAPNKNTLYHENMPYYYKKISDNNNLIKLTNRLKGSDINYADLKSVFENNSDILYFKRDSHWNNKGALLAYNTILDKCNISHYDYKKDMPKTEKNYIGDLNSMIYPKFAEPEENYYYNYKKYKYETDTKSVEDPFIKTKSSTDKQDLLMYRDSFGNSLIPFMSGSFKSAVYSKMVPYNIASDIKNNDSDVIIIEKVERNIDELSTTPPIMVGIKNNIKGKEREVYTHTSLKSEICEENRDYIKISGIIDRDWIDKNSKIYIRITNEDNQKSVIYQSFLSSLDNNDYGYTLYLDKDKINYDNAFIEIIGKQDKFLNIIYEDAISFKKF